MGEIAHPGGQRAPQRNHHGHYANSQAQLQIDSYGCQVNATAQGATAVAQRSSIMKLQYHTSWAQPQDDDADLNWIRGFYTSVYSATGGVPVSNQVTDGCYINYCDVDLLATWPALYYNHAQSIVPATQTS